VQFCVVDRRPSAANPGLMPGEIGIVKVTAFATLSWGLCDSVGPLQSCWLPLSGRPKDQAAWRVSPPLPLPGPAGSFDETAVKDPTLVRYGGRWHVFYTARGGNAYTLGYVSAASFESLQKSPRYPLDRLRSRDGAYAAAPQVFYFRPQRKWYLIFQTTDSNYQPVFSTTATIERPESWTKPENLVAKRENAKWIDFWLICDENLTYLFFTRAHKEVVVMTTKLADFPKGFGDARPVFSPLIEAAHIYRMKGIEKYMMLVETSPDRKLRRYGLATAGSLRGPWSLATSDFASGPQLRYAPGEEVWTNEVSHGELIRTGYDERLEVDPAKLEFFIQGMPLARHQGDYPSLPWRLG
jgi:endo-1,4-beta-xylanase